MTEPSESVMTRIMKLLNLANDESASPAERALAEEHAERMMAQHMVDRFEAEQKAKQFGTGTRKPVKDEWIIQMSIPKTDEEYASASEFDFQIIGMMQYILEHCNVRVNKNWRHATKSMGEEFGVEKKATDYTKRVYNIVGFSEDIAYAERIWFRVYRMFVSNVNPQWDVDQPIDYNAYNFASAGVSWKQQVLIAENAKDTRLEWPWRYQKDDKDAPFYTTWQSGGLIDPGNEPWGRSIHKLKRACKKYCTDNNKTYPYAAGAKLRVATRNSFARSYKAEIVRRMDEIRAKAEQGEGHVDIDKFALAVVDTKQRVDEEFYRLFPEYDPAVQAEKRAREEFMRACEWAALTPTQQREVLKQQQEAEDRWIQNAMRARRNYRTIREDPAERYDGAAWERGREAAQKVNLRDDAEVKDENRKSIK